MNLLRIFILIGVIGFFGCREKESAFFDEYCGRIDLDDNGKAWFEGLEVNGDPLPFISYYEDDDNYSEVTAFNFYLNKDQTWNSSIEYRETVSGSTRSDEVLRNGTWTCSGGEESTYLYLEESDGSDYGTIEWDESTDFLWILTSGDYEYLFLLND